MLGKVQTLEKGIGPIIWADKEDWLPHLGVSRDLNPMYEYMSCNSTLSGQSGLTHFHGQSTHTGQTFFWDPWAEIPQN